MQTYIEEYGNIEGVKDEKTIINKVIKDTQILITKQKKDKFEEEYYNVYFIDSTFRIEPLNNLNEQIPIDNAPKNWDEYLTLRYIEYMAWRDFNIQIWAKKEMNNE